MERNDNFGSTGGMGENTGASGGSFGSGGLGSSGGLGNAGGYGNTGGSTGSAGYGSSSSGADTPRTGYGAESSGLGDSSYGAGGANYASTGTQGGFGTEQDQGRMAGAKEKLGNAREAAGEKLGALKEKAGNLTATLADKLEAGAEKLRGQQGGGMAYASGGATAQDERMAALNNRLAGGMQGAADWLREGDLRATVEQQVREHPGRTLLIALGVGYVIGKALRK